MKNNQPHPIRESVFYSPRYLILIFSVVASLMVFSAIIELRKSREELMELMTRQSHMLLESILTSSENTLRSNEHFEDAISLRLLDNARFIKKTADESLITSQLLNEVCTSNHLHRIFIITSAGKIINSNHSAVVSGINDHPDFLKILAPLFLNNQELLIIGLSPAIGENGLWYSVGIRTSKNNVVIVSIDADELLEFRKSVGFGKLIQNIADNTGIEYIALQDTANILAASGNVQSMNSLLSSPFLMKSLRDSLFQTHIITFNNKEVFEAVHPFYYYDNPIGIYRIGLSMEALSAINTRIKRRIVIISIILTFLGTIMFFLILSRQNITLLRKQYKTIETYSSRVINNVSDAILVINPNAEVEVFNKNARNLFQTQAEPPFPLSMFFTKEQESKITASPATIQTLNWEIAGKSRKLLLSRNKFSDENDQKKTIITIRDITRIKQMEDQIKRKDQLSAMGALASGVAHEIRNPLNTISTIIQQLNMDFEPAENAEEYHSLAGLIHGEIQRINKTIQDFLHFSKPEPLHLSEFSLPEFLDHIEKQHSPLCREKNIHLSISSDYREKVKWDREKIKQVFTNLIQNAVNVMDSGGILIRIQSNSPNHLTINISDTGPGIAEEILPKIFNLYFTTRAEGTGIGLSMVQKIIDEHYATISVQSKAGEGTTFSINIPITV